MDKYPLIRKCLAVGIILLFISVTVAPSINLTIVKASNEDDLIAVTTQSCGIKGFGNTTVKLTREQYQDLEQYVVEFRARLNQTTTREEAAPIFNEAVVELNKYGLLPKGMSIEVGQKLVKGNFDNIDRKSILGEHSITIPQFIQNNTNNFCFIAGKTSSTVFVSIASLIRFFILYPIPFLTAKFFSFLYKLYPCPVTELLETIAYLLPVVADIFTFIMPTELLGLILFGIFFFHLYDSPAQGWVTSIGLNGRVQWKGAFYGGYTLGDLSFGLGYLGAVGFTGIKIYGINPTEYPSIFIGSALQIKLNYV